MSDERVIRFDFKTVVRVIKAKFQEFLNFQPYVYVSGPMSCKPNKNHDLFNDVTDQLRKIGFRVINPAENDFGSQHRAWAWYMRLDLINVLKKAKAIVMLPDWEVSEGATIEMALAVKMGIPIYNYDEFLKGLRRELKPQVEIKVYVPKEVKHVKPSTTRSKRKAS